MRILGIDPGIAIVGFGFVDRIGSKVVPVQYGTIETPAGTDTAKRLMGIHESLTELIRRYRPDCIAVEKLYFNRNVTTAFTVGQARGVVMLAGAQQGLEFAEYTPLQVKQAVVGYGQAEKRQVQEMVRLLLGLPSIPKPDDAADALAIAICHAHSSTFQHRLNGALGR